MKFHAVIVALACVFIFGTVGVNAQSVDLVYGSGRAFDIPSGQWMNFHAPGAEIGAKGFVFNITRMFDVDLAKSETDLTGSYSYQYKRLKLTGIGSQMYYHMPFTYTTNRTKDWRVWAEVRYTIYKR